MDFTCKIFKSWFFKVPLPVTTVPWLFKCSMFYTYMFLSNVACICGPGESVMLQPAGWDFFFNAKNMDGYF